MFGSGASSYKTIAWSFISCFKMTVGGYDYQSMANANPIIAPIYFVIFIILFFLIILNMFISIIGVAYEDTMEEEMKDHEEKSTKQLILNELLRQYNEIVQKLEDKKNTAIKENKVEEFEDECVKKLPILYRIFQKIFSVKLGLPKQGKDKEENAVNKKSMKSNNKKGDSKGVKHRKGEEKQEENPNPILGYFLKGKEEGKCKEKLDEKIKEENYLEAIDKDQRVLWLSMLESKLYEKTDRKIRLTDFIKKQYQNETSIEFYPKQKVEQLSDQVKCFVYEDPKSMLQEKMWDEADLDMKYEYWCGMDAVFAENYNAPLDEEPKKKGRNKLNSSKGSPGHSPRGSDDDSDDEENEEVVEDLPPLAPRNGEISLKSMLLSQEYCSRYAKTTTWLQWYYWQKLIKPKEKKGSTPLKEKPEIEEKKEEPADLEKKNRKKEAEIDEGYKQQITLWLFYFTPKQRNKLWKRMQFSKAGIQEYVTKNPSYFVGIDNPITIETIWDIKVQNGKPKQEGNPTSHETRKEDKETPDSQKLKIGLINCILLIYYVS